MDVLHGTISAQKKEPLFLRVYLFWELHIIRNSFMHLWEICIVRRADLSRCCGSVGRYFLASRCLDGHLSISKSCRQSTTSYINTCECMGYRPNVRAREDRATPQFTCYPTSNAPVPLGSGCDANPPHVRRNVLKRKAAFRRSLSSPVCCVCLFRAPRFWSTELAVTASDDRGIGEIAPGTPEDATVSEEAPARKASWTVSGFASSLLKSCGLML